MIVSTSKVLDRMADYERDNNYYTGSATKEGTLSLNVKASAAATVSGTVSGSGPGGPSVVENILNFGFEPNSFLVELYEGDNTKRSLVIKNKGDLSLALRAFSSAKSYFDVVPSSFKLGSGEIFSLSVDFFGKDLGVHTGYIEISGNGVKGFVPIIVQVNSEGVSGIVDLNVDEMFKRVDSGEEILLELEIGGFELGVVDVYYFIKDLNGKVVVEDKVSRTISEVVSLSKTLGIPTGLKSGNYVVGVEVRQGEFLFADSEFIVIGDVELPAVERPGFVKPIFVRKDLVRSIVFGIFVLLALAYFVYAREIMRVKKVKKGYAKEFNVHRKKNR
tara:strand:- start:159 stop:1154 length:996 start_codon:yes stop_codon:yes gene_type:complete